MDTDKNTKQKEADFRKLEASRRRRRSAWGTRKHAASEEATAYRIVRAEKQNVTVGIK